jgi:hypothetical protein
MYRIWYICVNLERAGCYRPLASSIAVERASSITLRIGLDQNAIDDPSSHRSRRPPLNGPFTYWTHSPERNTGLLTDVTVSLPEMFA